MPAEESAERPRRVGAEGGAVVCGAAGRDEAEVVRGDQQRLQHEVGGGAGEGVHQEPGRAGREDRVMADFLASLNIFSRK